MSQTLAFIQRLQNLKEGERSQLRRLEGRPVDTTLQGFDLFTGLWWPLRRISPQVPRREPSWLVAKLYSAVNVPHLKPDSGPGPAFAAVLGACEPRDEHKRFRARFDALICSPLSAIEPHLRWGLGEISRAVAGRVPHAKGVRGIDWAQFLDDLSIWDRGEGHRRQQDIREEWAEHYLHTINSH